MADEPLIFLSYASQDRDRVLAFFDVLKSSGLNVWMDKHSLKGGQNWDLEIKRALQKAEIIVVFLSDTSVTKRGYVQREIMIALDQAETRLTDDIYIIPIVLDPGATIPEQLSHLHAITGEANEASEALLNSIYAQLGKLGAVATITEESQPITWTMKDYDEAWEGLPGYDVKLGFIDLKSKQYRNIDEINDVIRGWLVSALHAERRVKFDQSPNLFSFGQPHSLRTNTWEAGCSDPVVTGTTISILYSVWWYGAGAAHPNQFFRSFCFSLDPLIYIDSLEAIFEKPDQGLRQIQAFVRDHFLMKRDPDEETEFSKEWVERGTEDWNALSAFAFRKEGIEIYFPPYQISSYADGVKGVVVPYMELIDSMDKNFQHLLGIAYLKLRLSPEELAAFGRL
jgi:hypothetical protein